MKIITTFLTIATVVVGGWWLWNHNAQFRNFLAEYVDNGEFLTLEARFTPQQIMDAHRNELLGDDLHTFEDPELKFHPYVMMEVKYTQSDKKTREGVVLWGLVDGEMVISTDNWDKTHGFEDAIRAGTNRNEFKILNVLAKNNGTMSREQLQKELHLEADVFGPWLDSAREKHLITIRGDLIQLHMQDPRFLVVPQTKINQWLVSKPYNHAMRVKAKYGAGDIEKVAKAAFGSDFTIRNMQEVFLPVYSIEVLNPDGSYKTTFWNALNGQRIQPRYLSDRLL